MLAAGDGRGAEIPIKDNGGRHRPASFFSGKTRTIFFDAGQDPRRQGGIFPDDSRKHWRNVRMQRPDGQISAREIQACDTARAEDVGHAQDASVRPLPVGFLPCLAHTCTDDCTRGVHCIRCERAS